ncbi:hypothetical protein [Ornithinimicrobium flavum]|uniref:hypothetical protein n=1 Tax=Ornithinimicrobium flavum TaxID=1288636 RepID=UPI0010703E56|nr:hypothetical protein [Ornithinimicrobium flavum]
MASHDSAAILHGLPIMLSPGAEVQLVHVDDRPVSRRLPGVVLHHSESVPLEPVLVDGLRTTAVPRTIADVMRTRRPPHALAVLDQSLRQGLVALEDVRHELAVQKRWVGKTRARKVLELVDPARESWAESYSYGVLAEIGFPMAIPQVDILDEAFDFVARVDGLLDHEGVFFEVDGEAKYFLGEPGAEPEETARRRLMAEERRHTRLEGLGLVGARWTPALAMRSAVEVSGRVNRAIARARGRTFTGWVRWQGRLCKLPLLPRSQSNHTTRPDGVRATTPRGRTG